MTAFANLSPAAGALAATREDATWTPITVDITPNSGELPIILAQLGTSPYDILTVYDGAAFSPLFSERSTSSILVGIYSFSILPVGGWLTDQIELDFSSSPTPLSLEYLVPDPPDIKPRKISDRGRLLGRDILFSKGDFLVGPQGDYLTVEGEENLRLAIIRRVLTALKEYQLNPGYGAGLSIAVKEAVSEANIRELRSRIVEQLLLDRRIVDVREIRVERREANPETLRVYVSVDHIENEDPLSVAFDVPGGIG